MINTILVPTDFSATAKNAALYAIAFAKQIKATKVVLYHNYQVINVSDPFQGYEQMVVSDSYITESATKLNDFKDIILPLAGDVKVEAFHSSTDLVKGIAEVAIKINADVLIMGITGGGLLKEKFVGSNTITVSKQTNIPLIVVPPNAIFKPIKDVLLVCDYKNVKEVLPVNILQDFIKAVQAKLLVVNVDYNNKNYTTDTPCQTFELKTVLQSYNPVYHFINSNNYEEAINDFVEKNNIDLIITIPKKHSLFENLFKESHTKKMAFHTHVPLLIVKEA